MKNIFKTLFIALLTVVIVGCEDNEKNPLPATRDGSFVTVVFDNLILDVTDLDNTAITGTLRAPVANVADYSLQVRRTSQGTSSAYVDIYMTDSFPSDFAIDLGQISSALGIEVSDFLAGDRFDFQGMSTSLDGEVVEFSTLGPDLQVEPGQKQSYQFTSFISCPFSVEEALGTYTLTACGLGFCGGGNQFEVTAGEEPNSVVLNNPYNSFDPETGEPFEIIIVVDPATGIGSIAEQPAFATEDTGNNGFFPTTIDATTGFYFSCTGTILFSVGTGIEQIATGGLFTFGTLPFEAQRN